MQKFPQTLRHWRNLRRLSQLALAEYAGVSSRHLSFLESGRANPSRSLVLRLAETLDMPLHARNAMLTAAGFAAHFPATTWSEAEMTPVRMAVETMLANHLPLPGFAVDRLWTVQMANASALELFAPFDLRPGASFLDIMTSDALPSVVENWPEVAWNAVRRLSAESVAAGGIPEFDPVISYLQSVPPPPQEVSSPVLPTILRVGDTRLSMFATIAEFGTPTAAGLDDLRIELYFPFDDESKRALCELGSAASNARGEPVSCWTGPTAV